LKWLASDNVKILTVSDLGVMWFQFRMFLWTSSSVETSLKFSAPYIKTTDDVYPNLKAVVEYGGLEGYFLMGSTEDVAGENAAATMF
jgi:hypothetical protein